MRCSVISKGLDVDQIEAEVRKAGGTDIKVARISKQVFCELSESGFAQLSGIQGVVVKKVTGIKTEDAIGIGRVIPPSAGVDPLEVPIYASSQAVLSSDLYDLRSVFSPPITGQYSTLCILDSGIRETHDGLRNKVIYEVNFSASPTCEDVFDHGTGVAYCAAGGRHSAGEESGAAPGAKLWNVKVLNDDGEGSSENAVLAIEHCIEKRLAAIEAGKSSMDPDFPNQINMSWGADDTGDPDSPLRVSCQAALEAGFGLYGAAGNAGPAPMTIMEPATDPSVIAVGAVTFNPFQVWEVSSRGPTKEGLVKPELVFFGVSVLTASAKGDDAFTVKSGTSFSTPYVCGLGAVGVELLIRSFGETVGMVDPVKEIMRQAEEAWEMYAPPGYTITVKPEGYSVNEKDNLYGFGLPLGSLMAQTVRPSMEITDIAVPLLGIGLLGITVAPIAKAMAGTE